MLEIKEKHKSGISIRQFAEDYSMSRATIRRYIDADKLIYWPIGKTKGSKLDAYKELIIELLSKNKTQEEILDILSKRGYNGFHSLISIYINKNRIVKNTNSNKGETEEKEISLYIP